MLESVRSTDLKRTTVHHALNGKVFGVTALTKVVPIKHCIRQKGGTYVQAVISFDPVTRETLPYKDLGKVEKCCQKVIGFNINHYYKCYLNGDDQEPYVWNHCRKCDVGIQDEKGHTIGYIAKRSYRRDSYIFEACETLQDEVGTEDRFKYQEQAMTNERD